MVNKYQIAAMLSAVLISTGSISAYAQSEVSVINNIGIGNVNISLTKCTLDEEGNRIPFMDAQVVVPGQVVDEVVDVTNLANDAWIRMKVTFDESTIEGVNDSLLGISKDWIKRGEYYYYMKPLAREEKAEFMRTVKIPETWDESLSDKQMMLQFTADAVQQKNFTPDFESDDPWFGTVIEQSITDEYVVPKSDNALFSVSYEGGAEGLVKVGDDFFSNWGDLMPGDVVSDHVTISNKYSRPVSIYFRTETVAQDKFLKQLNLQIKCGDKVLYDGSMDGEVTDKVLLGTLKKGESKELTYVLRVPAWLNNPYAMSKTKTKWIFTAVLEEKPSLITKVQTGDSNIPITVATAGMICTVGFILTKKKGREENE